MSSKNRIVNLCDDIVSRANKDGTFILMKMDDSDNFFKITGVAAQVWKNLNELQSISDIVSDIVDEFDVTRDQLNSDIDNFLDDLRKSDLIY